MPAIKMIFEMVGGLGIFLLGMKNMSEGMQAVAGERMRKLINAVTNNRLKACGVGITVTGLIQSSSVTTVMVVGMVNAGLMTLTQAIGVILGADIGTTVTAILAALVTGNLAAIIVAFSHLLFNICGILIWWPLRSLPIRMAQTFSLYSMRTRIIPFELIELATR